MKQYMSKTRTDYGSGVVRPKINNKDPFELKGQFFKELRENTFSSSDNEDENEHIEKVLEIVDLFHVPNIIVDQLMLRVFPISLTGAASRWLRNKPTGSIKTWEDLKTKFLNKYCPPGRTAKKMEEINNFQQEPDETLYQAWERFKELLMKCPQHYLTEMQETSDRLAAIQAQLNNLGREIKEVNEKVYAAQVGCGGYRATALGYYQRNNANPSYQERRQSMEDTLSKFMSESAKIHEKNSNLIKEIRSTTDAAIRNQGASIKTLEIQIWQMSKVLQERGFGSLPSSTETNPRDQVKSISTTMEADSHSIRRIGSSQYAVSTGHNSTLSYKSRQMTIPFLSHLDNHYCEEEEEGNYGPKFTKAYGALHINNVIPRKEKDPGSFTLPCLINNVCFDNALVELGASVSVMPLLSYLNLGLGELAHTRLTLELADRTVKYPKGIAENVLVGIDYFCLSPEIDVYKRKITLRVGEERIVFSSVKPDRSLDPFLEDYIELNDLNEPFELRRNQGDDLMPAIEEGEVIKEFRARDEELDTEIDDYHSYCDSDKKINIDYSHN
ncbi:mitochondrial proton/calcium exchanger protein-like protein isoform X1 [Tanacetum coccineum]